MGPYKAKKGLDLPISGAPTQSIDAATSTGSVAIIAADFHGMKPKMEVQIGDSVKRGQKLFEDRKNPGVLFTSPGAGTVKAVNRGAKRALQSVVIELNSNEKSGNVVDADFASFASYQAIKDIPVNSLRAEAIEALLLESGLWTNLRARPFSRVAQPGTKPNSIFVTAMDTAPLTADVDCILEEKQGDFEHGLLIIAKLTDGKTFLCKKEGSKVQPGKASSAVQLEEFTGKHPSGTVGFHIHTLDPVHRNKRVWHIGYQAVSSIGRLFRSGKLDVERVVALSGPAVKKPRLIKTREGARISDLLKDELHETENRVLSGSVLAGRNASGEIFGYLGRYANQISVLRENREREFLGWLIPGSKKFSIIPSFLSSLVGSKTFEMTTTTNGSHRAMVPIGMYEKVMPLDIMPTFLLRAIEVGDLERSEELGVLELDEEDLELCTFVCPGKNNWGTILRKTLTQIEKDG